MKQAPKKRGPKPEVLKIEDIDWKDAIKKSLEKKPPAEGWPKPPSRKKAKN
jgi:hypothetical protein